MSELCVIVMAAGKGKRMQSDLPKALHEIMGRPMIFYILDAAAPLAPSRLVVVIGHGAERVRAVVAPRRPDIAFAEQTRQLGTGHAVMQALPFVPDTATDVMVLSGDTPLITTGLLVDLLARHRAASARATVVTMNLPDPATVTVPTGYGRVIRTADGRYLDRIVEHRDATPVERGIREVNAGLYVFARSALAGALDRLTNRNDQGEYYLTDTIALLQADGGPIAIEHCPDPALCLGVNSPVELLQAACALERLAVSRRSACS